MNDNKERRHISNASLLLQYAGIGGQLLAGLVTTVFLGKWIDAKAKLSFPVLIWLLPLLFLIAIILKAVRDTSKNKNE